MRLSDYLWKWPNGLVWKYTRGITERSRRNRFDLFMAVIQPTPQQTILDVGVGEGEGRAVNFLEEWYPHRAGITAVALEEDLPYFRQRYPEVAYVSANGKNLPFADQSFDIYFSNAVIEHVGKLEDQKQLIAEACRVAKRVFLATPNRWFPLDAHTMIPFAHFLPLRVRNFIYRHMGRASYASEERLRLVGLSDLKKMIPVTHRLRAYPQRLLGLVSNINVVIEPRE